MSAVVSRTRTFIRRLFTSPKNLSEDFGLRTDVNIIDPIMENREQLIIEDNVVKAASGTFQFEDFVRTNVDIPGEQVVILNAN